MEVGMIAALLPYILAFLGPSIFAVFIYLRMNKRIRNVRDDLEDCLYEKDKQFAQLKVRQHQQKNQHKKKLRAQADETNKDKGSV
jgi:hypothetical protein